MPHHSTVTIFGGTGFLGQHIVRELAKQEKIIRIPSREPDKALPLKLNGSVGQIVPFHSSIRSDADVYAAIKGADEVINLTGISHEDKKNSFQSINVEAAARISRIAKEEGVKKFLHISTLGADNNSPSAYERSRAAGEMAVRTFFPDAVIFRPSLVVGQDSGVLSQFASWTRFSPIVPLLKKGSAKTQPVYVGDIARAAAYAFSKSDADGNTYELGGKHSYSIKALFELLLVEMDKTRLFINIPTPVAKLATTLLGLLPSPPITKDQLRLFTTDSIVIPTAGSKTFADIDIVPTAIETIVSAQVNKQKY